jgi:L-threonylcarbamoyladenylate synthase
MPSRSDRVGNDIDRAVAILRHGGLVAIPTETVYGLAADIAHDSAVERLFTVKGRPRSHPLIVHLADAGDLARWCRDIPPAAALLAGECWPGPLTIVVPRSDLVPDSVTGGRDSVAVRVPAHPLALDLLRRHGGALAAPSANRFGHVSPTAAEHVLDDLGDEVDYVLDGGPSEVGVESTIVDCTTDPPQVLRPGGLPVEDVERILGGALAEPSGPSRAPGMLTSHYAPACAVEVVPDEATAAARRDEIESSGQRTAVLLGRADLVEYAHELYARFREAEAHGVDVIIAVQPPARGLGHAIRDRLAKAAAPRP